MNLENDNIIEEKDIDGGIGVSSPKPINMELGDEVSQKTVHNSKQIADMLIANATKGINKQSAREIKLQEELSKTGTSRLGTIKLSDILGDDLTPQEKEFEWDKYMDITQQKINLGNKEIDADYQINNAIESWDGNKMVAQGINFVGGGLVQSYTDPRNLLANIFINAGALKAGEKIISMSGSYLWGKATSLAVDATLSAIDNVVDEESYRQWLFNEKMTWEERAKALGQGAVAGLLLNTVSTSLHGGFKKGKLEAEFGKKPTLDDTLPDLDRMTTESQRFILDAEQQRRVDMDLEDEIHSRPMRNLSLFDETETRKTSREKYKTSKQKKNFDKVAKKIQKNAKKKKNPNMQLPDITKFMEEEQVTPRIISLGKQLEEEKLNGTLTNEKYLEIADKIIEEAYVAKDVEYQHREFIAERLNLEKDSSPEYAEIKSKGLDRLAETQGFNEIDEIAKYYNLDETKSFNQMIDDKVSKGEITQEYGDIQKKLHMSEHIVKTIQEKLNGIDINSKKELDIFEEHKSRKQKLGNNGKIDLAMANTSSKKVIDVIQNTDLTDNEYYYYVTHKNWRTGDRGTLIAKDGHTIQFVQGTNNLYITKFDKHGNINSTFKLDNNTGDFIRYGSSMGETNVKEMRAEIISMDIMDIITRHAESLTARKNKGYVDENVNTKSMEIMQEEIINAIHSKTRFNTYLEMNEIENLLKDYFGVNFYELFQSPIKIKEVIDNPLFTQLLLSAEGNSSLHHDIMYDASNIDHVMKDSKLYRRIEGDKIAYEVDYKMGGYQLVDEKDLAMMYAINKNTIGQYGHGLDDQDIFLMNSFYNEFTPEEINAMVIERLFPEHLADGIKFEVDPETGIRTLPLENLIDYVTELAGNRDTRKLINVSTNKAVDGHFITETTPAGQQVIYKKLSLMDYVKKRMKEEKFPRSVLIESIKKASGKDRALFKDMKSFFNIDNYIYDVKKTSNKLFNRKTKKVFSGEDLLKKKDKLTSKDWKRLYNLASNEVQEGLNISELEALDMFKDGEITPELELYIEKLNNISDGKVDLEMTDAHKDLILAYENAQFLLEGGMLLDDDFNPDMFLSFVDKPTKAQLEALNEFKETGKVKVALKNLIKKIELPEEVVLTSKQMARHIDRLEKIFDNPIREMNNVNKVLAIKEWFDNSGMEIPKDLKILLEDYTGRQDILHELFDAIENDTTALHIYRQKKLNTKDVNILRTISKMIDKEKLQDFVSTFQQMKVKGDSTRASHSHLIKSVGLGYDDNAKKIYKKNLVDYDLEEMQKKNPKLFHDLEIIFDRFKDLFADEYKPENISELMNVLDMIAYDTGLSTSRSFMDKNFTSHYQPMYKIGRYFKDAESFKEFMFEVGDSAGFLLKQQKLAKLIHDGTLHRGEMKALGGTDLRTLTRKLKEVQNGQYPTISLQRLLQENGDVSTFGIEDIPQLHKTANLSFSQTFVDAFNNMLRLKNNGKALNDVNSKLLADIVYDVINENIETPFVKMGDNGVELGDHKNNPEKFVRRVINLLKDKKEVQDIIGIANIFDDDFIKEVNKSINNFDYSQVYRTTRLTIQDKSVNSLIKSFNNFKTTMYGDTGDIHKYTIFDGMEGFAKAKILQTIGLPERSLLSLSDYMQNGSDLAGWRATKFHAKRTLKDLAGTAQMAGGAILQEGLGLPTTIVTKGLSKLIDKIENGRQYIYSKIMKDKNYGSIYSPKSQKLQHIKSKLDSISGSINVNRNMVTVLGHIINKDIADQVHATQIQSNIAKIKNGKYNSIIDGGMDIFQQAIEDNKIAILFDKYDEIVNKGVDDWSRGEYGIGKKRWSFFRRIGMGEQEIRNLTNIINRLKINDKDIPLKDFFAFTDIDLYKRGFTPEEVKHFGHLRDYIANVDVETRDIMRRSFGKPIENRRSLPKEMITRFTSTVSAISSNIADRAGRYYNENGDIIGLKEAWRTSKTKTITDTFGKFGRLGQMLFISGLAVPFSNAITSQTLNRRKEEQAEDIYNIKAMYNLDFSKEGIGLKVKTYGNSIVNMVSDVVPINNKRRSSSVLSPFVDLAKEGTQLGIGIYDKFTGMDNEINLMGDYGDSSIGSGLREFAFGTFDNGKYAKYYNANLDEILLYHYQSIFARSIKEHMRTQASSYAFAQTEEEEIAETNRIREHLKNVAGDNISAHELVEEVTEHGTRRDYSIVKTMDEYFPLANENGKGFKNSIRSLSDILPLNEDININVDKDNVDPVTVEKAENELRSSIMTIALEMYKNDNGSLSGLNKSNFTNYFNEAQHLISDMFSAGMEATLKQFKIDNVKEALTYFDLDYKLGLQTTIDLMKQFDYLIGIEETEELYNKLFDKEAQEWIQNNIFGIIGGNEILNKARLNLIGVTAGESNEELSLYDIKEKMGIPKELTADQIDKERMMEYIDYFAQKGLNVDIEKVMYLAYNEIVPDELLDIRNQYMELYGEFYDRSLVEPALTEEEANYQMMLEDLQSQDLNLEQLEVLRDNETEEYLETVKDIQGIKTLDSDLLDRVGNMMGLQEETGKKLSYPIKPHYLDFAYSIFDDLELSKNEEQNTRAKEILKTALPILDYYGIDPALFLTQWAMESGWGTVTKGKNNYFNVMKSKDWDEMKTSVHEVEEYIGGEKVLMKQTFKDYDTLEEGIADYAQLLKNVYYTDGEIDWNKMKRYATLPDYVKKIKNQYEIFDARLLPLKEITEEYYRQEFYKQGYDDSFLIDYAKDKKIENTSGEEGENQLDGLITLGLMGYTKGDIELFLTNKNIHPISARMFQELIEKNPKLGDDRIIDYHRALGFNQISDKELRGWAYCASALSFFGQEYLERPSALASELYKHNGRIVRKDEPLKSGDLCFYWSNSKNRIGHVNIVLDVLSDGTVLVIGANQSKEHKYTIRAYDREQIKYVKRLKEEVN